jgi:hypothetical protein
VYVSQNQIDNLSKMGMISNCLIKMTNEHSVPPDIAIEGKEHGLNNYVDTKTSVSFPLELTYGSI